MGEEADALNDRFSGEEINDPNSIHYIPPFSRRVRKHLYDEAKAAKTGTVIECPVCHKRFRKKSYQQAFCSNKGRDNCKDKYWNTMDEKRLMRAIRYA